MTSSKPGTFRPLDYAIVGTRRSGSNLLCDWLRGAAIAGIPREHILRLERWQDGGFVNLKRYPEVAGMLPENGDLMAPDVDLIEHARVRGTGPNGVFGTKIFWHNFRALVARLDRPQIDVLQMLTPELRCIHLTRADKALQAISNWRAMQTGAMQKECPEPWTPQYHYGQILHIHRVLEEQDAAWRTLFGRGGIEPHTVVYEEFAARPEETVRGVLRFLGLPENVPIKPSQMRRQRDALSAEWLDRYTMDREQQGDAIL